VDTVLSITMCRARGGGDDGDWAKDGRGLCIIDGGCLINNAEDGNVETATGWVLYKARDVLYAGGRPEDGINDSNISGETVAHAFTEALCSFCTLYISL